MLSAHPDLCDSWLEEAGILPRTETRKRIRITTQRRFAAPGAHGVYSRPDLVIELTRYDEEEEKANLADPPGPARDLVSVESKIGSREGEDQLARYARVLSREPDVGHRKLVYITRDYDPKNESGITEGIQPKVDLVAVRWHDFHRVLEKYHRNEAPESDLIREVLLFMKEQGMSQSNLLSATDVVVLSGMSRTLSFMQESLAGEVEAKLREVSGGRLTQEGEVFTNLMEQDRYFSSVVFGDQFWCGAGFCFLQEDPGDYPWLSVTLEVGPNQKRRQEIISAMRSFLADGPHGRAYGYGLDEPSAWSGLEWYMDLRELLPEEDHMASAKAFFLESLDGVEAFRSRNAELPWNKRTPA